MTASAGCRRSRFCRGIQRPASLLSNCPLDGEAYDLASRRGQIAGISAEPDGPWGTQLMRNATDAEDGCLRHRRCLIHDRDPLFRPAVREFVAHYHHERNHQGLDNRLILPLSTAPPPRGRVPCRQRLGGMLHY